MGGKKLFSEQNFFLISLFILFSIQFWELLVSDDDTEHTALYLLCVVLPGVAATIHSVPSRTILI
jgi:hypothetical protein